MKKIGLLTMHNSYNYGSWAQAYALYKTVKEMGYEIEIIDYRNELESYDVFISMSNIGKLIKNINPRNILRIKNTLKIQLGLYKEKNIYWQISNIKYKNKNIKKLNKNYEIFLIGSDLVWDVRYTQSRIFMLDFASKNKKRISYAASYGYESIPEKEKKYFTKYLTKFQQITVREKSSKEELTKLLKMPVEHVCDPTMLLENREWKRFIKTNKRKNKYVLVYMPDERVQIIREAKRYARKHHCEFIFVSREKGQGMVCPYNIEEFLNLFYYAEKIFTGSYHGLMFSIYFEKEFAYINRKPANRMQNIAEVLGLEKYEINHSEFDVEEKINYVPIKKKEQEFRNKSKMILKEMLKDAI